MDWKINLTNVDSGSFRSLNGASDENIFIGKACKAGFYCFFKVWRDMPYDAVLDYKGNLYRIEIKGSGSDTFTFTHGSRSGAQIDRQAEDRTRLLSRHDGDFAVGVDTHNGDCYIVPMDIIKIFNRQKLSKKTLEIFLEKWHLFIYGENRISQNLTRDGLMNLPLSELEDIAKRFNIDLKTASYNPPNTRNLVINDRHDLLITLIWIKLAETDLGEQP